jgi:hypothetical protein
MFNIRNESYMLFLSGAATQLHAACLIFSFSFQNYCCRFLFVYFFSDCLFLSTFSFQFFLLLAAYVSFVFIPQIHLPSVSLVRLFISVSLYGFFIWSLKEIEFYKLQSFLKKSFIHVLVASHNLDFNDASFEHLY